MQPATGISPLVIVGSINVDLSFYTHSFPEPGETINGLSFSKAFGGKGANQAAMSGLLNANGATMIGKVASDSHGSECLSNLKNFNVNVTGSVLTAGGESTGTACIQVDSTGENKIIVIPGANALLTPEDISSCESFIEAGSGLICQLEVPPNTVLSAMKVAAAADKKVYFNPSPCLPLDTIKELLENTTVCVVNQGELNVVSQEVTGNVDECVVAGRKLINTYGIRSVITTLGSEGSVYITKDDFVKCPPAAIEGEIVDCVGAGDCFLATVVYELEIGSEPLDAMVRANKMAGRSICGKGAMTSYNIG